MIQRQFLGTRKTPGTNLPTAADGAGISLDGSKSVFIESAPRLCFDFTADIRWMMCSFELCHRLG
jgi:hypothetical protein